MSTNHHGLESQSKPDLLEAYNLQRRATVTLGRASRLVQPLYASCSFQALAPLLGPLVLVYVR